MPAAKISRNDVAEAIRILNRQGIPDPGVHRLRTFLGRGSVTTIARLKNELRQIELERITPTKAKPLPDPIARLAKQLWDELLSAVESVEVELKTVTEQRLNENQQKLDRIETERDQALTKLVKITDKLTHSEKCIDQQRNDIYRRETKIGELQRQLEVNTLSLENLREREQQLKSALAETARQSATRENTLNEQLNQERNRSFEAQRNAERRYQQLEKQFQNTRATLARDKENNERMMSSARERIHALEENIKIQNRDLESLRSERSHLVNHQQQLNLLILELEKQKASLDTKLKVKDETIQTLTQRIQELQNFHLETKNHYERNIKQLEQHLSEARKSFKK